MTIPTLLIDTAEELFEIRDEALEVLTQPLDHHILPMKTIGQGQAHPTNNRN